MRSGLRALLVVLASGAACKATPDVQLDVAIPSGLVSDTTWFEIGAFRGGTCAGMADMLANGIPDGAVARVSFKKTDKATPRMGELPNDVYAFGAVAKGEDCSVIGKGCIEVDVGDTRSVVVPLAKNDPPSGACSVGAACQAGRCVPANDNADPSVGAGCSLELLGAGPLANAEGGGGTILSAPAIAATPSGFLIAYREIDPSGGGAKLTLLPVDPSGGALPPLRPGLKRCGTAEEVDGVGLTMDGANGLIALARAPCDEPPALELLEISVTADGLSTGSLWSAASPSSLPVTLSASRAMAWRGGNGVVVYTEGDRTFAATAFPGEGIKAPVGSFGGTSGMRDAWVAATDSMLALLASGTGSTGPATLPDGGTADTAGGPTLRLVLAQPAGITLSSLEAATNAPVAPIVFAGEWGSIAAVGKRAIVLSDGSGPRSVTYRAFDLGSRTPSDTSGISAEGLGKATAGDVAIQGDRAYFAILKPGAISLAVFANATTKPSALRQTSFANEPRIPAVSAVRDGRVAIAATDKRVAVVWTTAKKLGPNDTSGGYAVFACTP